MQQCVVANICLQTPLTSHPRPWRVGPKVKIQLNQNMVTMHIKINAITMQQYVSKYFARIPPHPPPPPQHTHTWHWGWGQKVKIQLSQNMVMFHIKLNGIANAATTNTYSVLTHTLNPWGEVKTFLFWK